MNNIGLDGELVLDLVRTVPQEVAKAQYDLQLGDVLVCTTNSGKLVGKATMFDLPGRYAFSNHLTRLRPSPGVVDGSFLRWSLWLHWRSGAYDDKCKHWVNQSTIPKDALLETELAVAPLAEQRQIVAKLEDLLGKVEACRKRLAKIPVLIKRLRQSVLAAACSGRLTADWREEHDEAPAERRWNILGATGTDPDLPELPETWIWRDLKSISDRVSVGHVGPTSRFYCDRATGIPFVRSQNVRPCRLALEEIQYITRGFHESLKKSQLKAGDLLVVRVGANRGDTCRVPEGIEPLNCANIVFARPFPGISDYLELYCQSEQGQSLLLAMTSGSAQGVLNTKAVAELPIPIPPEAEQHEIVRRVEALFALADQIEARYAKAKAHVDRLTQSILAKAFRGELVPQDPNDKPASVVLERIKEERSLRRSGPGTGGRGRKPRTATRRSKA